MKQIRNSLSFSNVSILVLFVFIIIVGVATFIEEKYDTATAKLLIYNAKWFEFIMLSIALLFIVLIFKNKLFTKDKLPQLIFHISFIVLIIGGGVTRYFGFEANMHIVEDEKVSELYTIEPYFQFRTADNNILFSSEDPIYFSQIEKNDFHYEFDIEGKFIIDYKDYIFNAKKITDEKNVRYVAGNSDKKNFDALIVEITYKGKTKEAVILNTDTQYVQKFQSFEFDDLKFEMVYGPKPINLPFALKLNDFTLTKYPGTEIPSESESRVELIDARNNKKEEHLIAKNKVLDYDGYRFFQTSYDDDENGTILSVNYDYYGTRITYAGYILMALGALLVLISGRSGFSQYDKKIKEVRAKRKALLVTIFLLVGFSGSVFSQNRAQNPMSIEHVDKFGHILVQTYDGRFTSVHSLAVDAIHKISGNDYIKTIEKGKMDEIQAFIDMMVDPDYWKEQKIIVVREKALREILGISGKYASFKDFDDNGYYKLEDLVQKAYQKKASEQSTLDREVIKVTERVNIFMMSINGSLLKIFPEQNSENNKWLSWDDMNAFKPLSGKLKILNEDLKIPDFTYSNIMRMYLMSTISARESNDYSVPDKILGYISSIQRQMTPKELLPSERKIQMEIIYNKVKIFDLLKYIFSILGVTILILSSVDNFKLRPSKKIQLFIRIFTGLFIAAFAYQTFGMGLRWYLGGHAPWSNGYEVLLLVAWGGILAGLSVIKYSKITLASTAILASLILMTAGHSYYDPQLTNLNPVLKSIWLIIHVAIVTIGYGFLALSFIIGLISININTFKTAKKHKIANLVIEELTYINKKIVTIGMFLTSIGTFIGCVWANESWGTYWSWNAKQTWSLIIVLIYGLILHLKYIPKMKSFLVFNVASVISFGSVIMTFVGVNYYFTKGLHSYASDDPPIFPFWAWVSVIFLILYIAIAFIKEASFNRKFNDYRIIDEE